MSIYSYVGLPRQGKTYNVVAEQILPALKKGRRVVTNIPLNDVGITRFLEGQLAGEVVQVTTEELANSPGEVLTRDCTPGSLVVFDELWRFLPQGLTANKVDPAWKTLFAEHGHRVDAAGNMMQIVLVTQDLSQVSAFARALVERTFVVTKLSVVGQNNRFRVDVYQGHVTGLKPPAAKRISESFGSYDPRVFECYVSRTMAEGQAGKVDESTLDKRASLWRNPSLRFGVPLAAVGIAWGLWQLYGFFFADPEAAAAASAQAKAARLGNSSHLEVAPLNASASSSAGRWRISGVLRAAADGWSLVLVDHCDGSPSRWVRWHKAQCSAGLDGEVSCDYDGHRYQFSAAVADCRESDESRSAKIDWFPANAPRPSEPVSVLPRSPVDGTSG